MRKIDQYREMVTAEMTKGKLGREAAQARVNAAYPVLHAAVLVEANGCTLPEAHEAAARGAGHPPLAAGELLDAAERERLVDVLICQGASRDAAEIQARQIMRTPIPEPRQPQRLAPSAALPAHVRAAFAAGQKITTGYAGW